MSRWWCSRAWRPSTPLSRRPPWIWARGPLKVFFVITLPIIFPAILSGWLLAFTLSWDDLVISSFTSGPGSSTLPMVVFSKVRLGVSPEINVLATITITVVTLMMVGVGFWMSRAGKLERTAA